MEKIINHSLIFLCIIIGLAITSCNDISTVKNSEKTRDWNQEQIQVREDVIKLKNSQYNNLLNTIKYQYNNVQQISLVSLNDHSFHVVQIKLADTIITKKVDQDLNFLTSKQKDFNLNLRECKDVVVGALQDISSNKIKDVEVNICDLKGDYQIWTTFDAEGQNLFYYAEYSGSQANFPNANYKTEWSYSNTNWTYWNQDYQLSEVSSNPNTTVTLEGKGQTYGSDQVDLNWLVVNYTDLSPDPDYPPTTPILKSPFDGAEINPPFSLSWYESDGNPDPEYELEVVGNASYNELFPTSKTFVTMDLPAGTYTWRVRAINSEGYSNWSQTWSVTSNPIESLPTPTLSGSGTYNGYPTFSWFTVEGATSYEIQRMSWQMEGVWEDWTVVTETSYFDDSLFSPQGWEPLGYLPSHVTEDWYVYRIMAVNHPHVQSEWSDPIYFVEGDM